MAAIITKFAHLRIPLEDVLKATNNFHLDNIIGQGGFGPAYKGRLLRSGELIKISALRLDRRYGEGDVEFWTEISMLCDLKHTNIVSLVGFCDEKDEKIIITTYEAKGSLKEHLNSPNLTWTQRLKICVGVARALSYLHYDEGRGYGVIHLNINSSTILLDENWETKLSGFKVSIKQPINRIGHVILCEPIGTIGYVDPTIEKTKGVTHKSDVYSFGVVLFEILCGRRAYIKNETNYRSLAQLAKYHYENQTMQDIIHTNLWNQMFQKSIFKYLEVAYSCLKERAHRPDTNYIVEELEKVLELQLRFENLGNNLEYLKIPLSHIQSATDDFSKTYKIQYDDDDDDILYRAKLNHFDKENLSSIQGKDKGEHPKRRDTVVIKRYPKGNVVIGEEAYLTEIEMLSCVKHPNIVTLLGFCVEGHDMILVTEDVFNGFLNDYLGDFNNEKRRILTWEKRLKICIDVALALNYLHSEMEDQKIIIHSDISRCSIGLGENFEAKIIDFWSSVFLPPNQEDEALNVNLNTFSCRPQYMDPELIVTYKLKREYDVYSFGVVLFEILCGRKADDPIYIKESNEGLAHVARQSFCKETLEDIIDPILKEENNFHLLRGPSKDSFDTFIDIAYQCVGKTQDQRPKMKVVVKELNKALFFQEGITQRLNIDQVVDKLAKHPLTSEINEEGIQRLNRSQVVNQLKNLRVAREIQGNNLEHLKIPLTHIQSATHDFSETYKILSISNGPTFYRVELEHFDTENFSSIQGKNKGEHPKRCNTVVIKRYPKGHDVYGEEEYFTEIEMLSCVKHPNIVTLLGFCVEGSEMIIVTQNVSNGYLGDYLGDFNHDKRRILTWEKRLKICIDVAHALNYLHSKMEDQKMIIHRDINRCSIGLGENFWATIAEFWCSVFVPTNQQDEGLYLKWIGSPHYIDPEYKMTCKLKRESDVYSFGVVLFEILFGRTTNDPIYGKDSGKGLAPLARQSFCNDTLEDMIDPILKEESNFILHRGPNKDSLHTFIEIAHHCVAETQNQRPTMEVIVKELEKALFFQKSNKDNPRIPFEDINQATQNFHNDNCIGRGGFGRVFKGALQDGDGFKTIVAKKLDTRFGQGEQQFLSELQILLEYKHENVIGLVGYCDEKDEKIIVYEYAARGSLDKYLSDGSLTWVKRLNICIDVASALYFLHGGVGKQAKVIHRDIKTANILLNHDWKAKLADFGLSLISPLIQETDYVIDRACGTQGYLDPLYYKSGFLTIESDIYSFGIVLFEILCGRSTYVIKDQEGQYLPDFIKSSLKEAKHDAMVFEQIREQIMPKSLATFQEIAYQCLHHEREERPVTKKVLIQLRKALEFQNMASTMTKFAPLQIPLEDVIKATNNFDDANIIGHDRFGSSYKGRLLRSGSFKKIVARRFDCKHGEGDLKFLTEISVLSDHKHTNLVSIIGFCDEKDEKIIITTYETNRSLKQYINNSNPPWMQRLRISIGVARALSYLHDEEGRDYSIIHCNINSETILLDENWEAKLSGFEISIKQSLYDKEHDCLCDHINIMGCMDPQIEKTGGVTHKSDIYSFGLILFEILCGSKAFIQKEANRFLAPLVIHHYENGTLQDIIHHDLWNQMSPQSLLKYSRVAYSCLKEERADRPNAHNIVNTLEKALESHLEHENSVKKFQHLHIRLSDIKSATNNFSETYIISSRDGEYTLYRAELEHFDKENPSSLQGENKGQHPKRRSTVVIKRYPDGHRLYGEDQFFSEIEMLASVEHPNITTLLGFCIQGSEMIIVTQNVANGYIFDYLGNDTPCILTWEQRLKICIDAAHALNYLHSEMEDQKMIINRDICSCNIGLDEDWGAKIVDFWWSVFLPPNQEDEALYLEWIGRSGYVDPEYQNTCKLKRESDVYSFGVVLFEIICEKLANDPIYTKGSDKGLASVARQSFRAGTLQEIIDPMLKDETGEPDKDSLNTFIEIAYQCVAETQDHRPTMKVVLKELEKALSLQEKDYSRIPLEDIRLATQNFHDDNCIGGEGFWKVYKGNLQDGDGVNTIVAKRLDTRIGQGGKQFFSELQILSEYKHENIIGLVGYCDEEDEKIIVYEYASNGSLDRYLNEASLTWMKRLNICIDVASALDFIHGGVGNQAKVIHRDIKNASILLNEDWKAKLADFGISLVSPSIQEKDYVADHACGTPGYLDPLYNKSGSLTIESDIYSFGVVLFEILCGRSTFAIHEHEGHYLPDFIKNGFEEGKHDQVVSDQIRDQIDPKSLTTFQKIAYQCLHHDREKRPTTKEVLVELNKALEFQVISSLSPNQGFHIRARAAGRTDRIVNRPVRFVWY